MTKIVIVGGVAGGASAAARARRVSEDAEIIILERGEYISFANCGLPYHIGGDIQSRQALVLQTPDSFRHRFNVQVRTRHEVIAIDRTAKQVKVRDRLLGSEYVESYDKLLLSPGAKPITPAIPGVDQAMTLRTLKDMDRILAGLEQQPLAHVTVVGGGFIGLEMVEALRQRDIPVTLLELSAQVMAPIDQEMASLVHQTLQQHGVDLRLKTGLVAADRSADAVWQLSLSDGLRLATGMLILAIGVQPETWLAAQAGLELGPLGGIQVNDRMQTSDPDVFAVGDAVETAQFVTGQPALIPLAGPANRQGRLAADNMLGAAREYGRTQGTAICKVFELAVASTGLNEKQLKRLGREYQKVYVHPASHAGYYPGAQPVSLKLLFAADGQILGAQAVGKDGVDKRIDVLAVAMRAGLKVQALEDLELCYAPPFGSARDVINQAGMVATNVLKGDEKQCHSEDMLAVRADQCILDVRNPGEIKLHGGFAGALNIPLDELRQRLGELPREKEILISCQVGLRGHVAYRMLVQHGFQARNLSGGYRTFQLTTA